MPKSPDQNGTTTIWTIQHEAVMEQIERDGALRGSEERAMEDFRDAYRWIMQQMGKRLPDYKGGWPVWGWIRYNQTQQKPDLRIKGHLTKGDSGVLIKARVPSHLHLPHDYELWHSALYNEYLGRTEAETEAWEKREFTIPPAQRQEEKQRSWEYIFDLSGKGRDWRWLGSIRKNPIETVIEEIRQEWIVSVQRFTAR